MIKKIFCILGAFAVVNFLFAAGEGRPLKEGTFNAVELFKTPPNGYGEVPFYWWMGDTLKKEHLLWHLDMLKGKGVQSLQVNYAHSDKGGQFWGLSFPTEPALMSDKWWELFNWFKKEANARSMTVSLSDYTFGVGQEQFVDKAIAENPSLRARQLLKVENEFDGAFRKVFGSAKPLCAAVYAMDDDGVILPATRENVDDKIGEDGVLELQKNGRHILVCVFERQLEVSFDPTNPDSGKLYIKHFFGEFEKRLGGTEGLNFFFSDELNFNIKGHIWSDYIREQFKKRKSYDISSYLDLLFVDGADLCPKIRLDFNDVFVTLSEENFFMPIYDWHESRGLIYGCDHGGRGTQVDEFGDYFRTQRWNQGPGCDQPRGTADIIKNKVASSISHMYARPRVWLEGFYSSGWGQTTAHLAKSIFANFAMGQNLLSLHGLYYSTKGGWWEWAPPCNHFHQPYWSEMPALLKCVERLSFLLSQGTHCADVAIMYPVESKIAGFGRQSVDTAFSLARTIYSDGTDFDFVDAQSVEKAEFADGKIRMGNENFEVLIIPSMQAMRHGTLEKLLALSQAGARIWFVAPTPSASDYVEGFGTAAVSNSEAEEVSDEAEAKLSANEISEKIIKEGKNSQKFESIADVCTALKKSFEPDFKIVEDSMSALKNPAAKIRGVACVLHRRINGEDFYALYNIPKGKECTFRATGAVTLLNPFTGAESRVKILSQNAVRTRLRTPMESTDFQILRFDKTRKPLVEVMGDSRANDGIIAAQPLEGKWNFTLKPVLDNRWGDFAWPARREIVGAQIRFVKPEQGGLPLDALVSDKKNTDVPEEQIGFSTKFKVLGALPEPIADENIHNFAKRYSSELKPMKISMRYGLLGDQGHQGYHGLKAEISDDFIRLGAIKQTATSAIRTAQPEGNYYYLYTKVYAPREGVFPIIFGKVKPAQIFVNGSLLDPSATDAELRWGANELILRYDSHCTTHFLFSDPEGADGYCHYAKIEKPLSMSWNGMRRILPFDASTNFSQPLAFDFESAPALEEIRFVAFGEGVKVYIDGNQARVNQIGVREDGACAYRARSPKTVKGVSRVRIEIAKPKEGYGGGASIPYYINQICSTGEIDAGSWDKLDGLRTYSGGAVYSKKFNLPRGTLGKKIVLNLGDVGSVARVRINGNDAGVRFFPPWTFDISKLVRVSENNLEIEIYNTAANHYLTIPTRYRGETRSGLIGNARIEIFGKQH